jgi:hypothetical protein
VKQITLPSDAQLDAHLQLAQQISESALRVARVVVDELAKIRAAR